MKTGEIFKRFYFQGTLYALVVDDFANGDVNDKTAGVLRLLGENQRHHRLWEYMTVERLKKDFATCKEKFDDEIWFIIRDFFDFILKLTPEDLSVDLIDEFVHVWPVFDNLLMYLSDDSLKQEASEVVLSLLSCCQEVLEEIGVSVIYRLLGSLQATGTVPIMIFVSQQPEDNPYSRLFQNLKDGSSFN